MLGPDVEVSWGLQVMLGPDVEVSWDPLVTFFPFMCSDQCQITYFILKVKLDENFQLCYIQKGNHDK